MFKGSYESCLKNVIGTLSFTFGTTLLCLYALGCIEPFSVAMMAIINPAYAKEHHPMRVSGAGHQAAAWSAFFVDCHFTVLFIPIGLNLMFKKLNKQNTFLITYLTAAMYCSANQIVALSWLCPAACIITGYTINHYYETFSKNMSEIDASTLTKVRDISTDRSVDNCTTCSINFLETKRCLGLGNKKLSFETIFQQVHCCNLSGCGCHFWIAFSPNCKENLFRTNSFPHCNGKSWRYFHF